MFLPFLALKSQKCKHENWNGGVAFDWQVDVIVSALLGVSSYCDLSSTFDWTFGLDTGWTRISSLGSNVLDRSGTFSWSVDLQISQHPSGPTRFLHGGGACWKKMRSDEILPGKHLELLKETADSGVLSLALIWSPPSGGASHAGLLLRRWNVLLLLWRLLVSLQICIWQQSWGRRCWRGTRSWRTPCSRCTSPTRSRCRRSRWEPGEPGEPLLMFLICFCLETRKETPGTGDFLLKFLLQHLIRVYFKD